MYIVHLTSECAPFAKVGGLGDVVFGLSQELVRAGHRVEILLPKYDSLPPLENLQVLRRDLFSTEGTSRIHNTLWSAQMNSLQLRLLETDHPSRPFQRGKIYGCLDDLERFTYFCRAVFDDLSQQKEQPDVIHLHDWPASLFALLYRECFSFPQGKKSKIVLTIHNVEHQGRCSVSQLARLGLRAENFLTPESLQDPVFPESLNLLKGGILYADLVTTVSPTYEKEIKTPEGGCGLDQVLKKQEAKLHGILNGIDDVFWNPATDPHLMQRYDTTVPFSPALLNAKRDNRRALRAQLQLEQKEAPLVGAVTRLVPQKAPHLIKHALLRTLEKGGQFILLGSVPSEEIRREFLQLQNELKGDKNVHICLENDEALAHLIFGGCDLFVIPSLFEPCGLTQMIALRYATVPLVRLTGGLADTVFDIDTSTAPENSRNGFTFEFPDSAGVNWALDRALLCWKETPEKWQRLMKQGIQADFRWKASAQRYLELYNKN